MNEPPVHPLERRPEPPPPPQPGAPPPRSFHVPTARPVLAPVVLAVIVVIFLLQQADDPEFTIRFMKDNAAILKGDYYRLFTMMFLHGNADHLFFNGLAIYVIGFRVERLFGLARFALIYFLGGLAGSLASLVFTEGNALGASGAIFAVIGAEMVFFYVHRDIFGNLARQRLNYIIFIVAVELFLGFARPYIDNAAHIGGFVGGAVLAWFIAPRLVPPDGRPDAGAPALHLVDTNPPDKSWPAALLFAGALALILFFAAGGAG
ncbi:MAG: rhomboid family intramembrane serine protease [Anaerolineae bacterium]|nr:rhomboid family intramembrane serine protease [Anaerolineae bacterium]